jgi:hypothetical protein
MDRFKTAIFGVCAIVAAATISCSALVNYLMQDYEQGNDVPIPNAVTENWELSPGEGGAL